jgi:leucyl aminopeptidase
MYQAVYSPAPSLDATTRPTVRVDLSVLPSTTALGLAVPIQGPLPAQLCVDRGRLAALGFDATLGKTLGLPGADPGPTVVAVGIGDPDHLDAAALRDAAAAFARAASPHGYLAMNPAGLGRLDPAVAARAVVEGVLLARYEYPALRRQAHGTHVRELSVVSSGADADATRRGAERGRVFASATMLVRDLATSPHSHLTAAGLADFAVGLGAERGLGVEVFDETALVEMGCGGLLGVNAGSAQPPRLIKLRYQPAESVGRLAMVGKGIMYDSGGIGLKPNNRVHAQMKNDMTGAAAILATIAALDELGCRTTVTGYLMCTDNMPSGTAMALGDVITVRGGTTVEVLDSDAEGRLVLSDGLVLAAEQGNDAIVDIATLTGSCLRALGPDLAGVFGNDQALVEQVKQAAEATDEPVWQLPLHRRYGEDLHTGVADLRNIGADAVPDSIAAALFLSHFAGSTPWAHIDICGPAHNDSHRGWRTEGCSGFGARLLLELALDFSPTHTSHL